jgi:hypothetical protein
MTQTEELIAWSNSELEDRGNISKIRALLDVAERMLRRKCLFLGRDYDKLGTGQDCNIAGKRYYHVELWRSILGRKRGETT